MTYKFKKNQRVKFDLNVDFTDTSGPFIAKGTVATVLKRSRTLPFVWLQSSDFGIHKMSNRFLSVA